MNTWRCLLTTLLLALAGCLESHGPLFSPADFQRVDGFDGDWKYVFDGKPGSIRIAANRDGSFRVLTVDGGTPVDTGNVVGFVPLTEGHYLVQRCDLRAECIYALGGPAGDGWAFRWFFGEEEKSQPARAATLDMQEIARRHGVSVEITSIRPGVSKPVLIDFFRERLANPGPEKLLFRLTRG